MRVVFLEDVAGVARGGDVREVKNGFARNFLIPKNLAVPATHNSLQRINGLKGSADNERVKKLADMKDLAEEINGIQVNVEMRSGPDGQLYGSVTNAIIAERLAKLTERKIDRRVIQMGESVRELGLFEVSAHLHPDVEAKIKVLVHEIGTEPILPEVAEIEEGERIEKVKEEAQSLGLNDAVEIEDDGPGASEDHLEINSVTNAVEEEKDKNQ